MKNIRKRLNILTHRGLEPSAQHFYTESSFEAFRSHIDRGFGIEFDFRLTKDKQIVFWHDQTLSRVLRAGTDLTIFNLTSEELRRITFDSCHFCFFKSLEPYLENSEAPWHALHIKSEMQNTESLQYLITYLQNHPRLISKLILFDLKPMVASFLHSQVPEISLAASVAHSFDCLRFSNAVGNTLITLEELEQNKNVFDWAWLDEWDRKGPNGTNKSFYNQKVFDFVRNLGMNIALVTPELHGTSPGLLGGEQHEDSKSLKILFTRIRQIMSLSPNILCTNYPEEVKNLQ